MFLRDRTYQFLLELSITICAEVDPNGKLKRKLKSITAILKIE